MISRMAGNRRGSSGAVAAEAWRLLLGCTLAQLERVAGVVRGLGLSPGDVRALLVLDRDEPRAMGSLAQAWHCDASNVTWMVDRLQERVLVERRTRPTDRRVKAVVLTELGSRTKAEVLATLYEPPAGRVERSGGLAGGAPSSAGCRRLHSGGSLTSSWFADQQVAQEQRVHVAGQEVVDGLVGPQHDRLAAQVEAGVEHHRDAGAPLELRDQAVERPVGALADGLEPGAAVDVGHRREPLPPLGEHRQHQQHERVRGVAAEPLRAALVQHAGGERPERLAPLDTLVDHVL